jgi:hypothetical protein
MVAGVAVLAGYIRPHSVSAVSAKPAARSVARLVLAEPGLAPSVWIVEQNAQFDLYSNGLRIENRFSTVTSPRGYLAFNRAELDDPRGHWSNEPAGIVFHTTESHMAPFEENAARLLKRDGEGLLGYVRANQAYHFVIDRFGRVFRIVRESDYANHAGNSVWADAARVYINLNQSFFGVAFEAHSGKQGGEAINDAQVHAGRVLTEMLRSRYQIPDVNCVTHAQVSVNPSNGRAGYHTDWASGLPFEELGLRNNYTLPPADMVLFGFEADTGLTQAGGAELRDGLNAASDGFLASAQARNLTLENYRQLSLARYRAAATAERRQGTQNPNFSEEIPR